MGYTHYWQSTDTPPPDDAFGKLVLDTKRIVAAAEARGVAIAGWDGTSEAEITEGIIRLNGAEPDAYETFVFRPIPDHHLEFCKTARHPYDIIVCAILLRAKVHYGDALRVDSDGADEWETPWHPTEPSEWQQARAFYRDVFGEDARRPFSPLVYA